MFLSNIIDFFSRLFLIMLRVAPKGEFPPPLSAKEELECFKKMKEGDTEAKDKIILHNLRLVVHIVKKYYSSIACQDDLISIGTIGLIKAVTTFDCSKGARLSSYASRCIENEVLMFFRNGKKQSQEIRISDPIETDKEGNSLTLMDTIATDDTILDDLALKIESEKLLRFIDENLDKREKEIIIMRYGLYNQIPKTQKQVASKLGISRSYVSRIEKKCLAVLKECFEGEP